MGKDTTEIIGKKEEPKKKEEDTTGIYQILRLHYEWTEENTKPKLVRTVPEEAIHEFEVRNAEISVLEIRLKNGARYLREDFYAKKPFMCDVIYELDGESTKKLKNSTNSSLQ